MAFPGEEGGGGLAFAFCVHLGSQALYQEPGIARVYPLAILGAVERGNLGRSRTRYLRIGGDLGSFVDGLKRGEFCIDLYQHGSR